MKKVWSIFKRDLKIAVKDPLTLWIFAAPIVLAVIINIVSPGISDTTVNLAVEKSVSEKYVKQIEDYANVEFFDNKEEIKERVLRRDEVIGVVGRGEDFHLLSQGNETEQSLELARVMNALYHKDALNKEEIKSRLTFYSFGEKIPGLKRALSVTVLLLTTIVASMVIALGLVDEKNDKTIRAASVTPIKASVYVLSKGVIGLLLLFVTSVFDILILGVTDINWAQMMIMMLAVSVLSFIVSFVVGLSSSDFIEAAASIKMLMLPLAAGILVYELLNEKWHVTVYWDPFFWADKGITEIIEKTATWGSTILYTVIIMAICAIIYGICKKNIREHLN